MVGPWVFPGSRWVAPRELKDLRWPHGDKVADPWDAGSYVSISRVEEGHHKEHFEEWAGPNVTALYANGRGFSERTHIHTVVMDHIGVAYRDDDRFPSLWRWTTSPPAWSPSGWTGVTADVLLVAPFLRTVVGADTYVDQLW